MSGSYERAIEICETLKGKGVFATCDPRSVNPPCILLTPPAWNFVGGGNCTALGEWNAYALAPATGNADAWKALDALALIAYSALNLERVTFVNYPLSPDNPPFPAYQMTFTEGIDV